MKKYINIYLICIIGAAILSIILNKGAFSYDTGFAFGVINLLSGGLLFVIAIILLIAGSKEDGKHLMAASGLILLTGGITCSIFPLKLNG